MNIPTDTPSTDGAPDPEEVIAAKLDVEGYGYWINAGDAARDALAALAAAGLRVVPEDRPAQCPTCGPQDRQGMHVQKPPPDPRFCTDQWHDEPAGVPVLDDDTRREVEALIVMLTQNSFHLTQTEMNRIAELLADAYFGGTDGR